MKRFLFPTLLLLWTSCGPAITFDEPQPSETDNLDHFPKHLQGTYQSKIGMPILTISNKSIVRRYYYTYYVSTHISQADSSLQLAVGDTIIDSLRGGTIKRVGDSIVSSGDVDYTDTLFRISQNDVLRKYKGYYFMSRLCGKDEWQVEGLKLSKGQLMMHAIADKTDLFFLKEITETSEDTVTTHFKPTKRQFKKFVKSTGFNFSETYIKIRD